MAAAISITSILLKNEKLGPADSELLKLLETSSINSLEMTNDLMNMNTKLEDLLKESIEMHSLINHCVNLLKFKVAEKEQKINTDLEEIVLTANREKLWRVMSNLIVNAIKFSPSGAQIDIKLFKVNEEFVQVTVKDYGIGIPEQLRDKIFDIFTDAKRRGTSGEQPFGLGLAISKQIIEAHGGRISLESEVGKGSTFFVELPIGTIWKDIQKTELEEAPKANVSIIGKCEKAMVKLKENSAQHTLLSRRIKALHISVDLIERELLNLSLV